MHTSPVGHSFQLQDTTFLNTVMLKRELTKQIHISQGGGLKSLEPRYLSTSRCGTKEKLVILGSGWAGYNVAR